MREDTIGRPMEILLVEDSLTSARLTMGALRKGTFQHRMTWLSDGEEAIEFLFQLGKFSQAPRPDLILLDLGLPKRDGREVLAEIRGNEALKSIPVVILTASTSAEDLAQSESLQIQSYLTKPVDLTAFLELVQRLNRFWHEDMIVPTS